MGEGYIDRSEDRLTEGRIVHFVPTGDGREKIHHCVAAIVSRAWGPAYGTAANLCLFLDGGNDAEQLQLPSLGTWQTSVQGSTDGRPFSYHDPRACPFAEPTTG